MRKRLRLDGLLCGAAGLFYLANRFWLSGAVGGPLGLFLRCWANDLFAGLAMTAWLDLLLELGRRPGVRSWKQTVPFLLACGFVWEVLAPMWKSGAVCDPWDFVAYQVGGSCYLLIRNWILGQNPRG